MRAIKIEDEFDLSTVKNASLYKYFKYIFKNYVSYFLPPYKKICIVFS